MKVIITGATGMVGKAILLECLQEESITEILLISRNPIDIKSPKIKELLVASFEEIPNHASHLSGYNACFHCMGVSAVGLNEETYTKLTFGYTKILADTLLSQNPNITFTYVSGAGTDSTEKGRSMWARVKGKTENYILNLGFKDAYAFRPGGIIPEKGVKSKTPLYNAFYVILRPLFPLLRKSKFASSSSGVGQAMIAVATKPDSTKILEISDINRLAKARN